MQGGTLSFASQDQGSLEVGGGMGFVHIKCPPPFTAGLQVLFDGIGVQHYDCGTGKPALAGLFSLLSL